MTENGFMPRNAWINSAIGLIRQLVPGEELNRLAPKGPAAVYTTSITIWMLILQRLGKVTSLNKMVNPDYSWLAWPFCLLAIIALERKGASPRFLLTLRSTSLQIEMR